MFQSKKAMERFEVPKCYHPFLFGPYQETLNLMKSETGANINIPPPSVDKTELIISGEKEGVAVAKNKIMKIWEDMVCTQLPVPKLSFFLITKKSLNYEQRVLFSLFLFLNVN